LEPVDASDPTGQVLCSNDCSIPPGIYY
jgi:hypothetical protein